MIMRETWAWRADSTPPPGVRPEYQVSTNGRGAVVYLLPTPVNQRQVLPGGGFGMKLRPPKTMMDPSDQTTWQRPYRFT